MRIRCRSKNQLTAGRSLPDTILITYWDRTLPSTEYTGQKLYAESAGKLSMQWPALLGSVVGGVLQDLLEDGIVWVERIELKSSLLGCVHH